jgi:hypothetical protein
MKKPLTSQAIVEQYIAICETIKETTLSRNYRKGNREVDKAIKLFKILENDIELAKQTLLPLLLEENAVARIKSAAHCFALNICIEQAEKVLQEIACDEEAYGIFAFEAEMTLRVWRDQGYLKAYPEQERRTQ